MRALRPSGGGSAVYALRGAGLVEATSDLVAFEVKKFMVSLNSVSETHRQKLILRWYLEHHGACWETASVQRAHREIRGPRLVRSPAGVEGIVAANAGRDPQGVVETG